MSEGWSFTAEGKSCFFPAVLIRALNCLSSLKQKKISFGTADPSSKPGGSLHQQKFQASSFKIHLWNCATEEFRVCACQLLSGNFKKISYKFNT